MFSANCVKFYACVIMDIIVKKQQVMADTARVGYIGFSPRGLRYCKIARVEFLLLPF